MVKDIKKYQHQHQQFRKNNKIKKHSKNSIEYMKATKISLKKILIISVIYQDHLYLIIITYNILQDTLIITVITGSMFEFHIIISLEL